jgi:CysZ protein
MSSLKQTTDIIRESLLQTKKIYQDSKTIKTLVLIPLIITVTLYTGIGYYLITKVNDLIRQQMIQWFGLPNLDNFFHYLLYLIFSLIMVFLINCTLIISLSIVSIPFNGILAKKTLDIIQNKEAVLPRKLSIKELFAGKKSSFLRAIALAIFGIILMALAMVPFLFFIVFPLSCLLCSINFLDYAWEEDQLSTTEIINNIKNNLLCYVISGILCLLMASVPIVNIIVIPGAVIFFTVIYERTKNPKQI